MVRENDLVCPVCHFEMWIPPKCPACKSDKLSKRGVGIQGIKQSLQKAFPQARIGVVEKKVQELDADIVIATEYFFSTAWQPFSKRQFGVVAELSADQALSHQDFRTMEKAAYKLHRLVQLAAQQKAECIIQTWLPGVIKQMLDPNQFYDHELSVRKSYNLPPTMERISVTCKEADKISTDVERVMSEGEGYYKIDNQTYEITFPDAKRGEYYELLSRLPDKCIIQTDFQNYEHPTSPKTSK